MKRQTLLILWLAVAANVCAAYPPVTMPNTEVRTLDSKDTGRKYDLYIRKPADYDKNPAKRYPVLYLLDAQWHFKLLDAVIGGLVWGARRGQPRFGLLLAGSGVFGCGCTLAAVAPSFWMFAAALVIIGAAAMTVTNTTNSLMQLSTEATMRGRVMALRVGVALGGNPIGAPIVGWVANHLGPRWALGVGAASGIGALAVAVFNAPLRLQLPKR